MSIETKLIEGLRSPEQVEELLQGLGIAALRRGEIHTIRPLWWSATFVS
jgi:hypothetical protein